MRDETNYIPLYMRPSSDRKPQKAEVIPSRKELFAGINKFVTERGAWLTSIPGDKEVRMECVPDSTVPDDLRKLGYTVESDGDGERILPYGIVQHFVAGADGEMVLRVEGDTRPISRTVTHAGITRVLKFSFEIR